MNQNLLRPLFLIDGSHRREMFENKKLMQPIFLVDASHVKKTRPKPEKKIRRVGARTIVHKRVPLSKRCPEKCDEREIGEVKRKKKRVRPGKWAACRRPDEFHDDDHTSCGGAPTINTKCAPINNACNSICSTKSAPVNVRKTVRRASRYKRRAC